MTALKRVGLCCALAAGCAADADVVARLAEARSDAGKSDGTFDAGGFDPESDAGIFDDDLEASSEAPSCCDDAGGPPTAFAEASVPEVVCAAEDTLMYVLTKTGNLYRVRAGQAGFDDLGAPTCLPLTEYAATVDLSGRLWVVPDDGYVRRIDPITRKCEQLLLKLSRSPMAFLYSAAIKKQLLYTLEAGTLYEIDTEALTRVSIGALGPTGATVRSLAGTADGALFAFAELDGSTLRIGTIDVRNASVAWPWKAQITAPFAGGAAWSGDFGLLFGWELYRLRSATGETLIADKLPLSDMGLLGVAASPCAIATTK